MTYGRLLSTKLVGEGRWTEALAAATSEIAIQPAEPEAFFNRGQAHAGLHQWEEAIDDYERALRMDASDSALDPETLDDELFFALRTWADHEKGDPARAARILGRYAAILPEGRHTDDVTKWIDKWRGVEEVWYRDRA
ncbi:MAG TPA: tetratricopeptide repeat protein [Polyangia bacterium]|nr:tetratricopeptide repeat protein [Polyangia bacterium]